MKYGNGVLYRMCEDRPLHEDIDTIKSKLWIIGRSYAASIERGAGKNFNIEEAAKLIQKSDIDTRIGELKNVDRITVGNIHVLLDAHKSFTDTLKIATTKAKRSLASKYLHFHAPRAVFIFDSIANENIRKILAGKHFVIDAQYDKQYEEFVRRCIFFREEIFEKELGTSASPREIDDYLLKYIS